MCWSATAQRRRNTAAAKRVQQAPTAACTAAGMPLLAGWAVQNLATVRHALAGLSWGRHLNHHRDALAHMLQEGVALGGLQVKVGAVAGVELRTWRLNKSRGQLVWYYRRYR